MGCAPDTVLGTGIQTARKAVDDGRIGPPISATATMVTPGHERWHPDPDFYYQPGGGPLLDMGPYYITALVTILGPVVAAIGAASHTRTTRTIESGPRAGATIPVATDSHVTGVLVHESGVLSTLVMSFDAVATRAAPIELHGERGSLVVPDPNMFEGDVELHELGGSGWTTLPVSARVRTRVPRLWHRRSGSDARGRRTAGRRRARAPCSRHHGIAPAIRRSGVREAVESTCDRPLPVPLQALPGIVVPIAEYH